MDKWLRLTALIVLAAFLGGCGGGSGIGPGEIKKREDKLRDRLPIDWNRYNEGDFQGAIDFFTETLQQADLLEDSPEIQNEVKSEAHNGIAWSFFRQQDLDKAWTSFQQATRLNRQNQDAWVGWSGVALALKRYNESLQYGIQALDTGLEYNSAFRIDKGERALGHDRFDERHVRLMLAEAYFQLGRYSALDRPDPNNASAQLRLVRNQFRFRDPGHLLQNISEAVLQLQGNTNSTF